ncbi:hypothetical protein N0V84_006735 [Fusarium piperis]|uniref:Uncharacterized protein n=1 Tax=Fusarium piperis TaxID=1435070 RepID=A0A9W8WBA6_9HYPO|nr:hypothetical protein N0V84_006735 [Fusarium piperis]
MSSDSAHLLAMGLPSPRTTAPVPAPDVPDVPDIEMLVDQAGAIRIPRMGWMTEQAYANHRRRQDHNTASYMHNDSYRAYFEGLEVFGCQDPPEA